MKIINNIDKLNNILKLSANALGGEKTIKNLQTLKLYGYAQYAYMFAGGNISSSPDAPQKLIAANELQRIWDFQNDGFQMKERRNMLFPFAAEFGHSYFPLNQILIRDIAYNKLPDGTSIRVGEFLEDPLTVDGRRIRKLWSLTNPITMLNALLNQRAKASNLRTENELHIMDVFVDENVELIFAINNKTNFPQYVKWYTSQTNLGEINFTTTFTGYMPFNGIKLPMGYNTKMDFRDTMYFRMYVDGYKVNENVETLEPPKNIINEIVPAEQPLIPIEVENIDDGIWRISGIGSTTVIEFEDHLTIFELYWNQRQAKAIIEKANKLVPNKKVTKLIISHYHFDHTGGFRAAIAAGLKIYANRENEGILRELAERQTPHFNDILKEKDNRNFEFVPIDDHLRLQDRKTTIDIYKVISNNHMADAIFVYIPDKKIFLDSDIATAAYDWQLWPDSYLDNIKHYNLEVEKVSTVHEKVMTHDETLKYIESGIERTMQRYKKYIDINEFLPGYPIFRTIK